MNAGSTAASPPAPTRDWARTCSAGALGLALLLLAATFFLISPRPGETYPGARPWSSLSILRPLTELMSLGGLLASVRGVEVKDFAFHLAAALGLAWLGVSVLRAPAGPPRSRAATLAVYSQVLLLAWALLSLLSSLWSGEPDFSRSQALIYGLSLCWAVALAHTFNRQHLWGFYYGLVGISGAGAALCIWYYVERNPYHRPGFPIGNPTTLAAALLPAILVAGIVVVGTAGRLLLARGPDRAAIVRRLALPAGVGLVALVPLLSCLILTQARGALLALLAGAGLALVLLVSTRWRWVLAGGFAALIVAGGLWLFHSSHLDVAMARGATLRFRVYAWRYAVLLWKEHPIAGNGAGAYPRLAGQLSILDAAVDPAAFMAELVEHAHNELFEVFTEIGLVGGVTYVAGLLATFVAAAAVLRGWRGDPERWLWLGLACGLGALVADSLVGVGLRLPGVPAIYFTLLGVLWAVCRTAAAEPVAADGGPVAENVSASAAGPAPEPGAEGAASASPLPWGVIAGPEAYVAPAAVAEPRGPLNRTTPGLAAVCFIAAAAAGWLAVWNWTGVQQELAAQTAFEELRYADAVRQFASAEPRLLDPVRKVSARRFELLARQELARAATVVCVRTATSAPSADARAQAVRLALDTLAAASDLRRDVPALTHTDAVAAQTAEWLAWLERDVRPDEAERWRRSAELAWRSQRQRTPYDTETLLALTRYPNSLGEYLGLLRDALRLGDAQGDWTAVLIRLAQAPGFAQTLAGLRAEIGPITPQTDLDAIIASTAPEMHRLVAAWHALRSDYPAAAEEAGRAADLYKPLAARFPKLQSVALAEEARYLLHAAPSDAAQAARVAQAALDALPPIQTQQYEDMARPFRTLLLRCLLASGQEPAARAALQTQADGQGLVDRPRAELRFNARTDAARQSAPRVAVDEALAATYVDLVTEFIRRPAEQRPPLADWLRAALRLAPRELRAWSWSVWLVAETGDAEATLGQLKAAAAAGLSAEELGLIRRSLCQEFPPLCEAIGGKD